MCFRTGQNGMETRLSQQNQAAVPNMYQELRSRRFV